MLANQTITHTLCPFSYVSMSDFDQEQDNGSQDEQGSVSNEQTLTLDGRVYAMSALPAEAINVLNDLIRSENELNEHRFRMRQLSAAQQTLTVALNQLVANAGIEPISTVENTDSETDSQDQEAA